MDTEAWHLNFSCSTTCFRLIRQGALTWLWLAGAASPVNVGVVAANQRLLRSKETLISRAARQAKHPLRDTLAYRNTNPELQISAPTFPCFLFVLSICGDEPASISPKVALLNLAHHRIPPYSQSNVPAFAVVQRRLYGDTETGSCFPEDVPCPSAIA